MCNPMLQKFRFLFKFFDDSFGVEHINQVDILYLRPFGVEHINQVDILYLRHFVPAGRWKQPEN